MPEQYSSQMVKYTYIDEKTNIKLQEILVLRSRSHLARAKLEAVNCKLGLVVSHTRDKHRDCSNVI